jgi:hypothetical protein
VVLTKFLFFFFFFFQRKISPSFGVTFPRYAGSMTASAYRKCNSNSVTRANSFEGNRYERSLDGIDERESRAMPRHDRESPRVRHNRPNPVCEGRARKICGIAEGRGRKR